MKKGRLRMMGAEEKVARMETVVRVTTQMAEKYSGEFEPHEHRAIADMEASVLAQGGTVTPVMSGVFGTVERLWLHERGMLGEG